MFLFNLGFISYTLLFLSTNNKKRIDLKKNAAFNYEGMGGAQWLMSLLVFLIPIVIHLPFRLAGIPNIGLGVIGVIGVIGIIFHNTILNHIIKRFKTRKHIMAEGFRQK